MQKLRHAIADKEIAVAFQPKVDLVSHKVVGFEALARWKLKDGSFVSPDEFISLAETSGLITELDNLIFTNILDAIKVLNKVIGSDYRVAFNASILDLVSDNYISEINNRVTNSGLKTSQLELEVTETQAIHNYERVNRCLEKFVELGFHISIDDFGTGYSSLEHISEIPASTLKIDRCFINKLEVDSSSQHIVNMIMMLADTFEFDVVAEGVETAEQAQWLANIGCKFAQGYYFAKPMFIDELIVWLEHRHA
jgi:EAL domain-containing protein (putative c-di-GMP-specific phosphodiesterase class I)